MPRYRADLNTRWSPEQVFDYLARFSSAEEWDPGVVRAEALTPDPAGPDSEFRLVVRAMGRELPLVYRIVAFDRPHRVTLVADTGRLRSEDTITVEAGADGTRVVYDAELTFLGVARVANPLLARAFRRMGDAATAGLAAVLEDPNRSAVRPSDPEGP